MKRIQNPINSFSKMNNTLNSTLEEFMTKHNLNDESSLREFLETVFASVEPKGRIYIDGELRTITAKEIAELLLDGTVNGKEFKLAEAKILETLFQKKCK
jgi:hypothetical protein